MVIAPPVVSLVAGYLEMLLWPAQCLSFALATVVTTVWPRGDVRDFTLLLGLPGDVRVGERFQGRRKVILARQGRKEWIVGGRAK